jgi:uncharacterized membrane protein YkoI
MKRVRVLVAVIMSTLLTMTAYAGHRGDDAGFLIDPRGFDASGGGGMSPDEAANRAQMMHGGRVLSVTSRSDDGRRYYRVKLLSRGQVRVVRIDAGD